MRVDLLATEDHYYRHILPIFAALPENVRGAVFRRPVPDLRRRVDSGSRVLVGAVGDLRQLFGRRRAILAEHGAGQSYRGDWRSRLEPAYAGGTGRENVDLFLVPGPDPERRNLEAWPEAPVVAVGDPSLDAYLDRPRTRPGPRAGVGAPVVALAFHWENSLIPETRSAYPAFAPFLRGLLPRFEVLGHAHPRARVEVEGYYRTLGIPWSTYDEVLARADVVVTDTSSVGFEAAALGLGVVWLNAPWYRREVSHGLRFWDAVAVGVEVDDPAELEGAISAATFAEPSSSERAEILARVYSYLDGRSAERAAEAILALDGISLPERTEARA